MVKGLAREKTRQEFLQKKCSRFGIRTAKIQQNSLPRWQGRKGFGRRLSPIARMQEEVRSKDDSIYEPRDIPKEKNQERP